MKQPNTLLDLRWKQCREIPRAVLLLVLPVVGSSALAAQNFVLDNDSIPSGPGTGDTANVDFADVDLDGDWDAALARGGEGFALKQSQMWVNQGGLQGGTLGLFLDETDVRLPAMLFTSLDVEFADVDGDGDPDLHLSNQSTISPQGNRWWINTGGEPGGTLGFFADETGQRWIGLAGPGSSVPSSLVLPDGSFLNYSHDCDFGDLDNDGDLDLVHSVYFQVGDFGHTNIPTRIFLNDGAGFFEEFNPSGFLPPTGILQPGDPGLWCDGSYEQFATDTTGMFCDITGYSLSVEVGDLDGDFDLDFLLGDRNRDARLFANRLEGSSLAPAVGAGALGFRDVTALALPPGYFSTNHLEQELGDVDGDGDFDLLGTDAGPFPGGFGAVLVENPGTGLFANPVYFGSSVEFHWEGDFLDFDNDGDLDVWFTTLPQADLLYRNDGGFTFVEQPPPFGFFASLDAEAADTDGDGDYDVLVAGDSVFENSFLKNVTQVPDTHAPYLPNVETVGDQTASLVPVPVRVHVYDNAPYYITWYNATELEVTVDGVLLPPIEAVSSMGQVFRAELPGNLAGSVDYRFQSSDEYGNTGASAATSYLGSTGLTFAVPYGLGSAGTLGGSEPTLAALSVPFGGSTLYLAGHSDAPPGTAGFFVIGGSKLAPPLLIPGLVLANVGLPFLLVTVATTDAGGDAVLAIELPPLPSGASVFAQFTALDPTAGGELLSASKGLELITQ